MFVSLNTTVETTMTLLLNSFARLSLLSIFKIYFVVVWLSLFYFFSLNRNETKKPIYHHLTCATDTKNVEIVFLGMPFGGYNLCAYVLTFISAVRDSILNSILSTAGMM